MNRHGTEMSIFCLWIQIERIMSGKKHGWKTFENRPFFTYPPSIHKLFPFYSLKAINNMIIFNQIFLHSICIFTHECNSTNSIRYLDRKKFFNQSIKNPLCLETGFKSALLFDFMNQLIEPFDDLSRGFLQSA